MIGPVATFVSDEILGTTVNMKYRPHSTAATRLAQSANG
jgi:hypothetical protein